MKLARKSLRTPYATVHVSLAGRDLSVTELNKAPFLEAKPIEQTLSDLIDDDGGRVIHCVAPRNSGYSFETAGTFTGSHVSHAPEHHPTIHKLLRRPAESTRFPSSDR